MLTPVAASAEAAKDAAKWCQGPDIKKLKCGWAQNDEVDKTTHGTCPMCGTWSTGIPTLPGVLTTGEHSDGKAAGGLACGTVWLEM